MRAISIPSTGESLIGLHVSVIEFCHIILTSYCRRRPVVASENTIFVANMFMLHSNVKYITVKHKGHWI